MKMDVLQGKKERKENIAMEQHALKMQTIV
jgi:hypothetical protein